MGKLFLDLDGVLADFDGGFYDRFGSMPSDHSDDIMWKKINGSGTFFADLPVMEGAKYMFATIQELYEVVILTACPKTNYKQAALQKRQWVRKNISTDVMILPMLGGANKGLFMDQPGDILIDDMEKNCIAWDLLGGISIQHASWTKTLNQLNRIYTE